MSDEEKSAYFKHRTEASKKNKPEEVKDSENNKDIIEPATNNSEKEGCARRFKNTTMYNTMVENGFSTYREKVEADLKAYYDAVPFVEEPELTKELVKELLMSNDGTRIVPYRTTENFLRKLGIYHSVISYCLDSESIAETLWMVMNDIKEVPECQIPGCHEKVHWQYNHRKYTSGCCDGHSKVIRLLSIKGCKVDSTTGKLIIPGNLETFFEELMDKYDPERQHNCKCSHEHDNHVCHCSEHKEHNDKPQYSPLF